MKIESEQVRLLSDENLIYPVVVVRITFHVQYSCHCTCHQMKFSKQMFTYYLRIESFCCSQCIRYDAKTSEQYQIVGNFFFSSFVFCVSSKMMMLMGGKRHNISDLSTKIKDENHKNVHLKFDHVNLDKLWNCHSKCFHIFTNGSLSSFFFFFFMKNNCGKCLSILSII